MWWWQLRNAQETVILPAAVPEAKHTDGETVASKKAKPKADWELQPFLSEPWTHLPGFNFLICGAHQCLHRAALNSKPQTVCRRTAQSS